MATVTAGITLSSTDLNNDSAGSNSEALGLSVSKGLSVMGNNYSYVFATSDTSTKFLDQAKHSKCYVFLHNMSTVTAETILIELQSGNDDVMLLGAGEFALFPWSATHDLFADCQSGGGTPSLEVRVYQIEA